MQGRIVQAQLVQRLTKVLVIVRADGKQARKDTGLNLLEARQRLCTGLTGQCQRIADGSAVNVLDAGDHEANLTALQRCPINVIFGVKLPTRSAW